MKSLRQVAQCIGVSGDFSLTRDFLGYLRGAPSSQSILQQIQRLSKKFVNMNFIRVGSDQFTVADLAELDTALDKARDLFAQRQLGIGRIDHWVISTADANGAEHIGSDGEAEDLTNDWSTTNNGMDIFFVLTYATSTIGLSRVDGPCDKDAKGMDGSVVAIESTPNTTGFVLAHEAAHYLGLKHSSDTKNLMFKSVPNAGQLSVSQGNKIRGHCFSKNGC